MKEMMNIRNAKFAITLLLTVILTATAIAETNVSILYGWNGTAFAPVNIESDGSLKTTLNLSESIGIFPKDDSLYNLGSSSLKWLTGYFSNVSATQVCIGASCRTTWPSGGGSAWDISTSTYLFNNSDILDVNETKLNETIDAFDSNVSLLYGYNQSESEFRPVSITSGGALKMSVVEQSGLSGWVDDGTTVRLATTSDRVGIGTTSPTHEFHVVGDANITGTVYAHNFSGNSPIVFLNGSGAEAMRIDNVGDVGIGTTSPEGVLHVETSSWPNVRFTRTSTVTNIDKSNVDFEHETTGDMADGFGTSITLSGKDDAGVNRPFGGLRTYRDGSDTEGAVVLRAGTEGLEDFLTIKSSGKVGIGTTSPSERLDLDGGNISMGYSNTYTNCGSSVSCTYTCPAGKQIIGGGCECTGCTSLAHSRPAGNTAWLCEYLTAPTSNMAHGICANIK